MKVHGGGKEFECSQCTAMFTTTGSLHRHMMTHLARHQCPLCPESFRSLQLVEQHIRQQHSQTGTEGIIE